MSVLMNTKIVDTEVLYNGYTKLEKLTIDNGENVVTREVLRMGNSVCAIIKDTIKDKYIFVSQYRPGVDGVMVEIVAGQIDDGEKPEESIKREIMEETGYKVDTISHIKDFYTSPGRTDEIMSLFYVEVGEKINQGGGVDEGELIEIVEVSHIGLGGKLFFSDPFDLDFSGQEKIMAPYQLIDAKSIISVMWLENSNLMKDMSQVITNAKLKSL